MVSDGPVRGGENTTEEYSGPHFRVCLPHRESASVFAEKSGVARSLSGQILRSGTSIGANLAKVDAGQSKPNFISKCSIGLKEAHETLHWRRLLAVSDQVPSKRLETLTREADELFSILTAIASNISASRNRG